MPKSKSKCLRILAGNKMPALRLFSKNLGHPHLGDIKCNKSNKVLRRLRNPVTYRDRIVEVLRIGWPSKTRLHQQRALR